MAYMWQKIIYYIIKVGLRSRDWAKWLHQIAEIKNKKSEQELNNKKSPSDVTFEFYRKNFMWRIILINLTRRLEIIKCCHFFSHVYDRQTLFNKKKNGENTILVSTFWSYDQFGSYIFVVVNLVHVIFNLKSIWSLSLIN